MKKLMIMLIMMIVLTNTVAYCSEQNEIIDLQLKTVDTNEMQSIFDEGAGDLFSGMDISKFMGEVATGKWSLDFGDIIKKLLAIFFKESYANIRIMMQLIVLALITALLSNIQSSFGKNGSSEVAFFACYIIVAGIALKGFLFSADAAQEFVNILHNFVSAFIPIVMVLIMGSGRLVTAALFQPMLFMMAQIINFIIVHYFIPLLMIITALGVANNLSDKFNISQLIDLLKKVIKWGLGILLTIFVGAVSLQSAIAPSIDGVTAKTAKFAVSSFVPVVGKILSDSIEVVVGCGMVVKNAVGVVGLVVMILLGVMPLVKILANIAIYSLTAAVIEPVADKRLVKCIGEFSSSLTLLFIMMLSLEIMFLVSFGIVFYNTN